MLVNSLVSQSLQRQFYLNQLGHQILSVGAARQGIYLHALETAWIQKKVQWCGLCMQTVDHNGLWKIHFWECWCEYVVVGVERGELVERVWVESFFPVSVVFFQ